MFIGLRLSEFSTRMDVTSLHKRALYPRVISLLFWSMCLQLSWAESHGRTHCAAQLCSEQQVLGLLLPSLLWMVLFLTRCGCENFEKHKIPASGEVVNRFRSTVGSGGLPNSRSRMGKPAAQPPNQRLWSPCIQHQLSSPTDISVHLGLWSLSEECCLKKKYNQAENLCTFCLIVTARKKMPLNLFHLTNHICWKI